MMKKLKLKPLIVILSVVVVGLIFLKFVLAAGANMYLSPASATVTQNNMLSVAVRINTAGEAINAVQANLSYPAVQLQYVSTDNSGSAFPLVAETTGGGGNIRLARGTNGGAPPVVGDHLIATVNFKVLGGSGSAAVNFASGSAAVRATDNTDALSGTSGGNYTLSTPPSPPPVATPPASPPTSQAGSTPPATQPPTPPATGRPSPAPSATPPSASSSPSEPSVAITEPAAPPEQPKPPDSTPLTYSSTNSTPRSKTSLLIGGIAGLVMLTVITFGIRQALSHKQHIPGVPLPSDQKFIIGGDNPSPPPTIHVTPTPVQPAPPQPGVTNEPSQPNSNTSDQDR